LKKNYKEKLVERDGGVFVVGAYSPPIFEESRC